MGLIGRFLKSPVNVNAAEDHQRPRTGYDRFPYPSAIGALQGLLPLMDAGVYQAMGGRVVTGPWTGFAPDPETVFPDYILPQLQKAEG